MYRLLKPKNIHRALIGLILLAPIAYLFGTQIGALAGAHGEEVFAEPVYVDQWEDVSSYDGPDGNSYRLIVNDSIEPLLSSVTRTNRVYFSFQFSVPSSSPSLVDCSYVSFYYASDNFKSLYLGGLNADIAYMSNGSYYDVQARPWSFYSSSFPSSFIDSLMPYSRLSRLVSAPSSVVPENAGAYTDYLFGNMFGKSNFLTEWGEDALSEDRHGFAPVGELFKYVDDNMLHLSDKQIGKMAYGYMYYVVHVLIFDIVALAFVFVVTIPQKVLNMINDKTGGDL